MVPGDNNLILALTSEKKAKALSISVDPSVNPARER